MINKIKILYVVSTLKRTGPNNVLFNLIKELDNSLFDVTILTLSDEDPNSSNLWDSFKEINVQIISFSMSRFNGFLSARRKIKKLIYQKNITIVHLFGFRADFFVNSGDYKNVKIVSTIHSNISEDYTMLYGKIKGKIIAFFHIYSLKGKKVIACSEFVAESLYKKYGINFTVIYNGIPKDFYTIPSNEERIETRKKLDIPIEKHIFIFIGYLIYRKDPFTVIKAFLNSEALNNSILLIIGDGPLIEECKMLCKNNEENIKFLGNQPSTIDFLKASNFYISSAYSEGLPTSVMEAMGCGLPVILSDIKPHRELISKIKNWHYLFPINNNNLLSKKINEVINDDYDIISNNCRAVISEEINSEVMAKNYQKLYLSI